MLGLPTAVHAAIALGLRGRVLICHSLLSRLDHHPSRDGAAMASAVFAESRYDPRADEIEALDVRLTERRT